MTDRLHRYAPTITWTGNTGDGTVRIGGYRPDHVLSGAGKDGIAGASDPAFGGDPARWNPEELLVAALSSCHMLCYLAACARARVMVTAYEDTPEGIMRERPAGGGQFVAVTLHPRITISTGSDPARAARLHGPAHRECFIAASVNFPVTVDPVITQAS
ncbi:MAG: OsmC family protein [Rubellimicrobium sp.]|nr:OsmC family protein [Rubellimicrobium sp.]